MKNWHRNYFFESTGSKWIPPSPNLRTTKGSVLYPGIEILQNAGSLSAAAPKLRLRIWRSLASTAMMSPPH